MERHNKRMLPYLLLSLFLSLASTQVVWNMPQTWNIGLPSSIQVFQTNSSFSDGVPMTAAYCKINLNDPDLELKVASSSGDQLKTPSEYMQEESSLVYMVVNGVEDGKVIAPNVQVTEEPFFPGNITLPYYTTAGSFGILKDGTPEITWTYSIDSDASDISDLYSYPEPAPNCFNCTPLPVPNASYPSGGQRWNVNQAVGAGPVLMKNGNIDVTVQPELIKDEIAAQRNPRTAICITEDQELIVMVVDGRYELSAGLFLEELAEVLQEVGCRDALNLDGGGSSAMVVNNVLTNRPSDPTGERPVTSAIMIVSKTKKNAIYS